MKFYFHLPEVELNEKEILIKLGARIKAIRESKNITLVDMEVETGMGNGHLSLIENGNKLVRFYTIYRIARALKIEVSDLVKDL